ncbi:MAG: CARDB domain-containing protein [Candidatus Promineifilaceae bacterium]
MKIETKNRRGLLIAVIVFQAVLVLLVHIATADSGLPQVRQAEKSYEIEEEVGLANCRYGLATLSTSQVDWVDDLGAGWYLNFGPSTATATNSAEYVPVISVKQNKDSNGNYLSTYSILPALTDGDLGALIDVRPGILWIVGNEVDRGPNPGEMQGGQGDTYPAVYARAYHDVYNFIKQRDPTAQVANSALVEVTPGRLKYLDLMWNAYKSTYGQDMPVDVWNMHLYILPEVNPAGQPNGIANVALGTSPSLGRKESGGNVNLCPQTNVYCIAEHDSLSIFNEQVVAMRTWMLEHSQRNKPLILSEFSILYPYEDDGPTCFIEDEYGNCFTPQRVINFLNGSMNYLLNTTDPNLGYPLDGNRLVQQSLWFSVNNQAGVGNVSDLVRNNALTQVGQAFKAHVLAQPQTINLLVDSVNNPIGDTNGGATANVQLMVEIRNNGNKAPSGNFFVTFYKDAALTQPIGTTAVTGPGPSSPGMTGCARQKRYASINWNNLTPGVHKFWVKVDSTNAVIELTESDNFGMGTVFINAEQMYIPIAAGQ